MTNILISTLKRTYVYVFLSGANMSEDILQEGDIRFASEVVLHRSCLSFKPDTRKKKARQSSALTVDSRPAIDEGNHI